MMARKKDMWDGNAEFSFIISEEEFNKRHKKARKDAEPSGKKKKKKIFAINLGKFSNS